MNRIFGLLFFFITAIFCFESNAQLIHKVKIGDTFYSLSKKYDIPIESLIKANPHAEYGLRNGMSISVPSKEEAEKLVDKSKKETKSEFAYIEHKIRPFETFYSLKNKYNLDREDILKLNPELATSFRAGKIIKIPVIEGKTKIKKTAYVIKKDHALNADKIITQEKAYDGRVEAEERMILKDQKMAEIAAEDGKKRGRKDEVEKYAGDLHLSYVLPLYLDDNDQRMLRSKKINEKSEYGIHYIHAAKLALKEWEKSGMNIGYSIYDSKNSKAEVIKIANKASVKKSDIVIGPFYTENVIAMSQVLPNQATILAPLSGSRKLTKEHKNVFQAVPSELDMMRFQSEYIERKYADLPVVLIKQETESSKIITNFVKGGLNNEENEGIYYKELSFADEKMFYASKNTFEAGQKYVVIIASKDRAFVSSALSGLNKMRNTNLITFVHPVISKMNLIDREYLTNLNVHYPSLGEVNYDDEKVMSFVEKFRAEYGYEPNARFAFLGYDITNFALTQLSKDGNIKSDSYLDSYKGLKYSYLFKDKDGLDLLRKHGYINKSIKIYQFEEFKERIVYPFNLKN
ncbi:MAG: LysM peptidoglycan-binding domain-containing protein [Flavobacteriales bacterium]|jgi:LysM repeat protein|nr:LysM peptidoglycan-binding domain-containing protein [Flavobacteriales bacterium]